MGRLVRDSNGLLSREWYAGCVDGDDPRNSFRHLEWRRSQPVLVLERRDLPLEVDRDTGRPAGLDDPPSAC